MTLAAVDLGASSGRVIRGDIARGRLEMRAISRFPNAAVRLPRGAGTTLHWDVAALYAHIESGLREAGPVASIGIDTWAVDYALMRSGRLIGPPYSHRDPRVGEGVAEVARRVSDEELYRRNGLQHLPFNTVYQLTVDRMDGALERADRALLLPDLLAYWLTGRMVTEVTNASTTGLLGVHNRQWDTDLFATLELTTDLFAPLVSPGDSIGDLSPDVAARLGGSGSHVSAVGSHDTASAIVAVPFDSDHAGYISSGTWSLVGLELAAPVITEEARRANFTNEAGVDGAVRFLKNVSGLWLLSESMRHWEASATDSRRGPELQELLTAAAEVKTPVTVFDTAAERFLAPGDIPDRIADWCLERGLEPPRTRPEIVRSILESLAIDYSHAIDEAERLANRRIDTIHIVGGGSQNSLLCQLTARSSGRTVVAGPVEATAIGNLLVQARTTGLLAESASLHALREVVSATFGLRTYLP